MVITKAVPEDHEILTKLTVESKSHWNYSEAQIKEWIADLTITPEYIEKNHVYNLIEEDRIVGYYSYFPVNADEVELDNLFVTPDCIGKGFGRALLLDFFERAKSAGYSQSIAYSDPNSEIFYTHFGFEVIGQEPTSIKNRFLPIMSRNLDGKSH